MKPLHRWRLPALAVGLGLCGCTTLPPRVCPTVLPPPPLPPIPAECTLAQLAALPAHLHLLPADFAGLPAPVQDRLLVWGKARDTHDYQQLRDRLLRCAKQLVEDRASRDNSSVATRAATGASRGLPTKDGQP